MWLSFNRRTRSRRRSNTSSGIASSIALPHRSSVSVSASGLSRLGPRDGWNTIPVTSNFRSREARENALGGIAAESPLLPAKFSSVNDRGRPSPQGSGHFSSAFPSSSRVSSPSHLSTSPASTPPLKPFSPRSTDVTPLATTLQKSSGRLSSRCPLSETPDARPPSDATLAAVATALAASSARVVDSSPLNAAPTPVSSASSFDRRCARRSPMGPLRMFCLMERSGFPSSASLRRLVHLPSSGATRVTSLPEASTVRSGAPAASEDGSSASRLELTSRVANAAQVPSASGSAVRSLRPMKISASFEHPEMDGGTQVMRLSLQSSRVSDVNAPMSLGKAVRALPPTHNSLSDARRVMPSGRVPMRLLEMSSVTSDVHPSMALGSSVSAQPATRSSANRSHAPIVSGSLNSFGLRDTLSAAKVSTGSASGSMRSLLSETSSDRSGSDASAVAGRDSSWLCPRSNFCNAFSFATSSGSRAMLLCDATSAVSSFTSHHAGPPLSGASKLIVCTGARTFSAASGSSASNTARGISVRPRSLKFSTPVD